METRTRRLSPKAIAISAVLALLVLVGIDAMMAKVLDSQSVVNTIRFTLSGKTLEDGYTTLPDYAIDM